MIQNPAIQGGGGEPEPEMLTGTLHGLSGQAISYFNGTEILIVSFSRHDTECTVTVPKYTPFGGYSSASGAIIQPTFRDFCVVVEDGFYISA